MFEGFIDHKSRVRFTFVFMKPECLNRVSEKACLVEIYHLQNRLFSDKRALVAFKISEYQMAFNITSFKRSVSVRINANKIMSLSSSCNSQDCLETNDE